jgi:integration host factor subunit alpha
VIDPEAQTIMTKAEIVQVLYERVGGCSKREAATLVDATFEIMKETLGGGEHVKVSGFGKFALRDKRERPGRSPQTGEAITIEERRVLSFKASPSLRAVMNPEAEASVTDLGAVERRASGVPRRG